MEKKNHQSCNHNASAHKKKTHPHPQALMTIGYYICSCVCLFFGFGSFPYGIAYCIFRSTTDSYGFISEIASDARMSNQINIYFYSFEKIVFNQTENLIKFFSAVLHSLRVACFLLSLICVVSTVIFVFRISYWLYIYSEDRTMWLCVHFTDFISENAVVMSLIAMIIREN